MKIIWKKIVKISLRNVVFELREGLVMWGIVEIVLVWWDDIVVGDVVLFGLFNFVWFVVGF